MPAPNPHISRSVLVVDDHVTFAELLTGALVASGMRSVGVASSAAEAVTIAGQEQPDVVVMDIEMPRHDGLAATRQIREVAPNAVIAVVTAHRNPDWVVRAAHAGASAFIPKDGSLAEMIDILGRVQPGQMLVAPSTFASGGGGGVPAERTAPPPQLTKREQEVLDCLGRGMQVKAIARVLGITLETCRGYVKALHAKLGVRSQLEAVVKAQECGLLSASGR